ncbi:hypothetical protein GF380_02385, partial [Candidatus Uhrbacteria bacterium]|nr:hypothetical protein [Candidatus Uhrbacteria bacterium]
MKSRDLLTMSVQNLRRGGLRSILSILGIVIGISAVILILSISEAGQRFIINQVAAFGSDLVFVESGSPDELEGGGIPTPFPKDVLTKSDAEKLNQQPWVRLLTPVIFQQDTVNARGEVMNAEIVGTSED